METVDISYRIKLSDEVTEVFDFKLDGERAILKAGKSRFTLSTLPAADFPNIDVAEDAHDMWLETKLEQGWEFGEPKDNEKRKHPGLVPFSDLSKERQISNGLTPYSVVNFFRTKYRSVSLAELHDVFEDLLDGEEPDLMDELGEYVHSHFMANLIAKSETVDTRDDMVVYEDLSDEVKSWDLVIAQATLKYLLVAVSELED